MLTSTAMTNIVIFSRTVIIKTTALPSRGVSRHK